MSRPKGKGLKNAKQPFSGPKIALHLKKVCYTVSLCEYCQLHYCKAFNGRFIRAKMGRRGRPLLRENLAETDKSP